MGRVPSPPCAEVQLRLCSIQNVLRPQRRRKKTMNPRAHAAEGSNSFISKCPFRTPYGVVRIEGSANAGPGEVSLAHNGV